MKIDVYILPETAGDDQLRGRVAAVIDILRASTTIAAALAAGCKEILPQGSMEDAARLKLRLDNDDVLMGGEKGGIKVPGYDLGNSPLEYTPETVGGKTVVLTTTNGSRTMVKTDKCLISTIVSFHRGEPVETREKRVG